ncbi:MULTISPECIES: site-2 protease family protein [unclassified Streptomyces]|uniref:site-2 protease family protein n=1 Tax=unclassified Streptomyces TaxID=2593676 RepID=UPI002442F490|nr:site-2 protease family protein [Streptomyces sp. DH41]MDG9727315.1 site-2 protease family protein [Streptomyces sp. DH41]
MDVSGGSGQPRSGNDESAEPQAGPQAQAADATQPEPADSGPPGKRPADRPRTTGEAPEEQPRRAPETAEDRPLPQPPGTPGRETSTSEPGRETSTRDADPETPGAQTHGREGAAPEPPGSDGGGTLRPSTDPAAGSAGTEARRPDSPHARGDRSAHAPARSGPDGRGPHADSPRTDAHESAGPGPGRPPQRRPEPGGGLLMGRPFGVPVYVAPSWFLVAALITWVFGGQLDRVLPELGAARYLVSLFFAVAFYASVLVHELAHTVAALRFKLPVRRIQLQFFGGVSEIEKEAETPGREFVLAFVGPLLSLVLAGVFYAALLPVDPDGVPGVLLAGLMISNLLVAAFNLLPGLPLDGGRMLRAVVWKITGKPMHGTIAAAWVGRALAIAVLIGLPLLTQSLGSGAADDVGMDTILDALLAAILAAIIWTGAGNSLRMARLREHLPELRARALTRRAVPVPADTPLSEALRRANASGARALVVVDADGRPVSLVREAAIVGVPEHRRPWVPVSTLAQDLTEGMRLSAELSGEELLDALRADPATEYLVVEETGEIYGVLSAADVERAFVKAMARPS